MLHIRIPLILFMQGNALNEDQVAQIKAFTKEQVDEFKRVFSLFVSIKSCFCLVTKTGRYVIITILFGYKSRRLVLLPML